MSASRGSARPLAWRVGPAMFAVAALSVAAAVGVFYTLWSGQTVAVRTAELARQVSVIGSGVAVGQVVPGSPEDLDGARARLLKVEGGIIGARLAVTDASGNVLFSTAGASGARSYPVGSLAPGATAFDARSGVLDVDGVGWVAVAAVPVGFTGPETPDRYLVGAQPVGDITSAGSWVLASIAAAVVTALVFALFLGGWLSRRITGPLVRLTEGARDVAAGEWGRQVPVEGDDEVAELATAFNEMSERVAVAYDAQKDFVGDVSHELRTPITSISGFSRALRDGMVTDPAEVRRIAGIIHDEGARLADLTTTLLSLADLDSGTVEVRSDPVDVPTVLAGLETRFASRADAVGAAVEFETDGISPLGDPERLLQAASALVENALRHAGEGGRVIVAARGDGPRWRLDVDDDGPGVPEADRERVFGRFTRLDSSRASSSGGTGLGLAICRRTVELMGGEVAVSDAPGLGGARFTISLPRA